MEVESIPIDVEKVHVSIIVEEVPVETEKVHVDVKEVPVAAE